MSDVFRIGIKARLKHGVLLEALEKRGWTQSDAARYLGVAIGTFTRWINLREVPSRLTEEQKAKLFELTGQIPEQLWSDFVRSKDFLDAPKTFAMVHDVDTRKLLAALERQRLLQTSPADELFEQAELAQTLEQMLGSIPPREAMIIRQRFFEDRSQKQVAEAMEVTPERIRQLEARGLRMLRHPRVSGLVKPFIRARDRAKGRTWRLCVTGKRPEDREIRENLLSLEDCRGWMEHIDKQWASKGLSVISATAYGPDGEVVEL